MSEYVLLINGDLLTKERLEAVRRSRRIERTPKRRFQYVVFIPGLFHFKMACADALWRTWIQPQTGRQDPNSLYQHAGVLRPQETGKIGTKPGFRRMHDLIHHDIAASMLNCWGLEAEGHNKKWSSLDAFANSQPSWDLIVEMSEDIVLKYVGNIPNLREARKKPDHQRDKIFENQILRNRDELLYVELSHAMNAGDIGRVEETFLQWIYIFKATGKHKYAWHTLQFMFNLWKVYPPELVRIIRMNWLCNPTGRPDAFRAVDWVVERNNLYTKVIYGGSGSNRTIDHIVEESILIELFRECHVTVENGFHLEHRTIRHGAPDMRKTLKKLGNHMKEKAPHVFMAGRNADCCVDDKIFGGLQLVQTTELADTVGENDEQVEVEADDLAAE
ncbi:hypothetical protein BDZ97DRAFT_1905532 [Flammula alnicola]|nr:hypothetical protein BDZ97DRAFT_1905532 [Flammula alnicola]